MLNFNTLTENCGGDHGLVVELAQIFLEEYPGYVAALDTAMSTRNSDGVRFAAHRLRGALGIFDAQAAMDAATQLEDLGLKNDLLLASQAIVHLKTELLQVESDVKRLVRDDDRGRQSMPGDGARS